MFCSITLVLVSIVVSRTDRSNRDCVSVAVVLPSPHVADNRSRRVSFRAQT